MRKVGHLFTASGMSKQCCAQASGLYKRHEKATQRVYDTYAEVEFYICPNDGLVR